MMKMAYRDQLLHPNWQRKRLEMLEAAGWECASCGGAERTLHVHHKRYVKGRMAWEYEADELEVLCESCHKEAHAVGEELTGFLANVDTAEALSLLTGYWIDADWFDAKCGRGSLEMARYPHAAALGLIARLCRDLSPSLQRKVAAFAVSISRDGSDSRYLLDDLGGIFKKLG